MLRRRLEAVDEEDEIILAYYKAAAGKQAKRLWKRHRALTSERDRIASRMESIWEALDIEKSN